MQGHTENRALLTSTLRVIFDATRNPRFLNNIGYGGGKNWFSGRGKPKCSRRAR